MMTSVIIICSRCGQSVKGLRDEDMTGGFYDVTWDYWAKFANEGEVEVCDDCMFADPRYIAVYGDRRGS